MTEPRAVLDVSGLPNVTFGHRNINWWGTLGFMVIEGTTLMVAIGTYFYLRQNFASYPPEPTPLPGLLIPTLNALLLLAIILPMRRADKASRRLELREVRRWLLVTVGMTLVATVLRIWEFRALNVRWDAHAYGSAAWATLGFHTALLGIDLIETALITLLMFVGPLEEKHFADVSDAAFYQYFLSLSYVLVYVVLFISPRLI